MRDFFRDKEIFAFLKKKEIWFILGVIVFFGLVGLLNLWIGGS